MVAVLARILGVHNLSLAEDVVQDAFCRAVEIWPFRGVPENPSEWLMATAKNRALDLLRHEKTARTYEPELSRWLQSEWTLASADGKTLLVVWEVERDGKWVMGDSLHCNLTRGQ